MKRLLLAIAVLTIAFSSCRKEFDVKEPEVVTTKTMDDLNIDDSFEWKTTKDVSITLNGATRSAVFINSTQGDNYHKGILFSDAEYTTKITVPAYVDKVKLVYDGGQYEVPIVNNKIEFNF